MTKDPRVLAEELVLKYSDQAYFAAIRLQGVADQLGDIQSAQMYQEASKELKAKGYHQFQEAHKLRIEIVAAAGGVIMSRQTFDEVIRELERAGVNVSIHRPTVAEQRAFDDAVTIAALQGGAGSRINELLNCLPDPRPTWTQPLPAQPPAEEPEEPDELTKLENRLRSHPPPGATHS
jgi:hypothetical protein